MLKGQRLKEKTRMVIYVKNIAWQKKEYRIKKNELREKWNCYSGKKWQRYIFVKKVTQRYQKDKERDERI